MYRFRALAVAVALVVIVSLGCGDISNTTGSGSSGSAFTVTVGSGTTLTYTWSAGDAFSVTVVRTSAATAPVWRIASPGSELISSAVTETPLTAGTQYRVTISRLNGDTGFIEFTP